jgi:uncharacterized Zn finger protein
MKILLKCENCNKTDFFKRRTALKKGFSIIESTYECKNCGERIETSQSHKKLVSKK